MDFDNTNSGALFKAEKKSEKHPDYTGSLNVDGVDYFISSWLKTSKSGTKFMSLSVTEKGAKTDSKPAAATHVDDEIPF
jgi:hypothetical protein